MGISVVQQGTCQVSAARLAIVHPRVMGTCADDALACDVNRSQLFMPLVVGIGDYCLGSLCSLGHDAGDLFRHVLALFRLGGFFLSLRGRRCFDAFNTEELRLENCTGLVSIVLNRKSTRREF